MILNVYAVLNSKSLSDDKLWILTQGINKAKLEEINFKKNKSDADNSIIGINLARAGIQKTFSLPLNQIEIQYDSSGKPYIYNNPDIHISITHSGKLIACAVSDEPVGIDAESIRKLDLKIVHKYFSLQEIDAISNCHDKNRAFTSIWTKKEAALKCSGIGIKGLSDMEMFDKYCYNTAKFEQYIISTATKKKEL